jgi:hypothetical protein
MILKSKIIARLDKIKDEATLKEIDSWLDSFLEADETETFDNREILGVQEGYEQYLAGNLISQNEATNRFKQWLAEKEL